MILAWCCALRSPFQAPLHLQRTWTASKEYAIGATPGGQPLLDSQQFQIYLLPQSPPVANK